MMNLLNPATLQQQLDIYAIKTRVENYLLQHESLDFGSKFVAILTDIAPDISSSVHLDIGKHGVCFDTTTQTGLNSYLRMFYLSLPFDTTAIRNYIVDVAYHDWVRYFVNILLFSFIEYYRGYHNGH